MFFRNRAKKKSFTSLNLTFLLLKTMFDSISRILLFSTWLYVINDGQFSSTKTVIAYYSTFILLFIFNAIINKHRDYKSARNWIGIHFWVLLQLNVTSPDLHTNTKIPINWPQFKDARVQCKIYEDFGIEPVCQMVAIIFGPCDLSVSARSNPSFWLRQEP